MKRGSPFLLRGAWIALLPIVSAGAVSGQTPPLEPFFEVVSAELETLDVFAVDGASVARVLGSGLGWAVEDADVEAGLSARYRMGPLFVFLACEAEISCVVAGEGSHAELARATFAEDSVGVELQFSLSRSDEGERGVFLGRLDVNLARSNGAWSVVGGVAPRRIR